jgi:hypothetical protein
MTTSVIFRKKIEIKLWLARKNQGRSGTDARTWMEKYETDVTTKRTSVYAQTAVINSTKLNSRK